MDEFRILTAGVVFKNGKRSKNIHFIESKHSGEKESISVVSEPLNFFGEAKEKSIQSSSAVGVTVTKPILNRDQEHDNSDDEVEEWFHSDDQINRYRNKHRIHVFSHGSQQKRSTALNTIPAPIRSFDDLTDVYNVESWIIDNIKTSYKFKAPTPIQKQAVPCILTGQPLLASAPTGSGKTVAFLLPLIVLLKAPGKQFLRLLIVVPSRELAVQTVREFDVLRGHKNFRCRVLEKQTTPGNSQRRPDCGVSTPLKLVQLLREGQVTLTETRHIVLDEADRLLDLGFSPQLDAILSHADLKSVQLLFFSATLASNVLKLAESVIFDATRISIGAPMAAAADITQKLVFVTNEEGKLSTFRQMVTDGSVKIPALVFVQTIERAKELFTELVFDGMFVDVIHAERPKKERDNIIQGFREKKIWILICTDLMARGVDFKGVRAVINWDLPQSSAAYIHRIGRTGRAGRKGTALTFFTLDDVPYLRTIVGVMRQSGCEVSEWMLNLKKPYKKDQRRFSRVGISRKPIQVASGRNKQVLTKKKDKKTIKKVVEGVKSAKR